MTLQYLLFWGMESGLLLLRERQRSLWQRLRAAPVPLWAVLLGKATSTASIALLQVLVTFAFGAVVFGVSVGGSWVGFALLAVGISAFSAATGLLVAAVGGTEGGRAASASWSSSACRCSAGCGCRRSCCRGGRGTWRCRCRPPGRCAGWTG